MRCCLHFVTRFFHAFFSRLHGLLALDLGILGDLFSLYLGVLRCLLGLFDRVVNFLTDGGVLGFVASSQAKGQCGNSHQAGNTLGRAVGEMVFVHTSVPLKNGMSGTVGCGPCPRGQTKRIKT